MISFSTDDIRPQDRFAHWCEVRSRNLFGVTIDIDRSRRADFQGRFWAKDIGGAIASEMVASSYNMERTKRDIARQSSRSLILGWQVRGAGWLQTGDDVQFVGNGGLVIGHSDVPFVTKPKFATGFHFLGVKIALDYEATMGIRLDDLAPGVASPKASVSRPLHAMFKTMLRRARRNVESRDDIGHLLRLALIARGRLAAGSLESRATIRWSLFYVAREIMNRDLHKPTLTPDTVARELGVSLRQLHILFEPRGQSFARALSAMRVDRARQQLESFPQRPIAEVARLCGFDSLATFYRTFNTVYGLTPGDFRDLHTDG